MLNQVVNASAILAYIGNQLAYNIQLVEAWEYKGLVVLAMDELLQDVQCTVFFENVLPEVCCGVSVGVGRVALASVITSTVRALIEGQEVRVALRQLGRHKHIGVVNAEVG